MQFDIRIILSFTLVCILLNFKALFMAAAPVATNTILKMLANRIKCLCILYYFLECVCIMLPPAASLHLVEKILVLRKSLEIFDITNIIKNYI